MEGEGRELGHSANPIGWRHTSLFAFLWFARNLWTFGSVDTLPWKLSIGSNVHIAHELLTTKMSGLRPCTTVESRLDETLEQFVGLPANGSVIYAAAVCLADCSIGRDGVRFAGEFWENQCSDASGRSACDAVDPCEIDAPRDWGASRRACRKRRRRGVDWADFKFLDTTAGATSNTPVRTDPCVAADDAAAPASSVAKQQVRRPRVRWSEDETDELVRLHALFRSRSRPGAQNVKK